jgi:hypothetical protein
MAPAYPPPRFFPSGPFRTFHEQMFASAEKPVSTLLRRGIDRAVQFATLGEFAVDEAPQPSRRRRPASPPQAWRPARTASQVVPATAAGRRRGEPPKRVPTRAAVRSLAMRPAPADAAPRGMRKRAGQPAPRPQPCIAR